MLRDNVSRITSVAIVSGVGIGVFWYVWGAVGFWWGVLYGLFWQVWVGYRMARWLFGG